MSNASTHRGNLSPQFPGQETACKRPGQKNSLPSQKDISDKDIRRQCCIRREISHIRPEDFLPILCAQWPAKCELFSKIVADCELWRLYREKAAEAFCKADGTI